jgi:glutaredoxin
MGFAFLSRWLGRSPPQRTDLHVLVYTRYPCPLCDEVWQLLGRYRERYGFVLEAKNVDEAAELMREYGEWVPVVTINGRVRFRGHVNEVLLRRILDVSEPERPAR